MTKIYLITGFLGAGKTTFLNEQLKEASKKTGVLMNEFGKISMDSITVSKNDIDLLELKNGSIFCACLKDKFIDGLIELVKMDLDEIFIESSGLSDPSNMLNVLSIVNKEVGSSSYDYKGSICLIDGMYFFEELDKLVSVERQVKHSHFLLINKADCISASKLADIQSKLQEMNSRAAIGVSEFGKIDFREMDMKAFDIESQETTNREDNKPKNLVIKFTYPPTEEQLRGFLGEIQSAFYRIKGFVNMEENFYKVDTVQGQLDIHIYDRSLVAQTDPGYDELVCLSSEGLKSISVLAGAADRHIAGLYTLQI